MKFKYLIIAFGIIILIIVLLIAVFPLFLKGSDAVASLRFITLPLLAFIAVLLVFIGIFFFSNYRLLSLLEREDWPALAYYLEQKIYVKNRYSARLVRILASSYMVIMDYSSLQKLESKALIAKPSVVEKNALIFGAAKVFFGSHKEAAVFFKAYLAKHNTKDRQWVQWYYGFSQLLAGAFPAAETEFSSLAVSCPDALITGLSAYFLAHNLVKHSKSAADCEAAAESGKIRVKTAVKTPAGWIKEMEQMENEIHVAVIKKYIKEAGDWLFS